MNEITVVALGPGDAGLMTLAAAEALKAAGKVWLRTARHGAAEWLAAQGAAYESFDADYDAADDFDALNAAVAERLLALAGEEPVCYAVPDPATDATVAALRARGARLRVLAGVSQTNSARAALLGTDLEAPGGLVSIPAADFHGHRIDPALPLLVTELNSALLAGEVKLGLLDVYAPETRALFSGAVIALDTLDRQKGYSHESYVLLPPSPYSERARYTFNDLLDVMARLRRPGDGCPWDLEQTHKTLREYLIEEAYEAVDAIDQGDPWMIADELGDVLLQVVFNAQVAKEHGEFAIGDVTTAICHKMITRHAHIFGEIHCETAEDVLKSWDAIKRKEKGQKATSEVMRDVPGHYPALMRAGKVQKKARQAGFDWDRPEEALAKVREEADEVLAELMAGRDPEAELGDLLFAVVNAARLSGVQAEVALGLATEKFIRRFTRMEGAILADGKEMKGMTLPEMDAYWDAVKRAEKEGV